MTDFPPPKIRFPIRFPIGNPVPNVAVPNAVGSQSVPNNFDIGNRDFSFFSYTYSLWFPMRERSRGYGENKNENEKSMTYRAEIFFCSGVRAGAFREPAPISPNFITFRHIGKEC